MINIPIKGFERTTKSAMLSTGQLSYFSKISRWFVLFLMSAFIFVGVDSLIGLYADGSNFLMNILTSGTFYDFDKPRLFIQLITQAPVVFAIKLGVHNLGILRILHSVGLVAFPLLVWMLALLTHYKTRFFWFFLLAFSVVYLNSNFFAVGEYNLTYAIVAWSAALLIKERFRILDGILLLVLSFILIRSYEAMIFLGPLLYVMAMGRILLSKNLGLEDAVYVRFFLLAIAFFYAASWAVSGWSILFPRAPANLAGARNLTILFRDGQYFYSIVIAVIYFSLSFFNLEKYRKIVLAVAAMCMVAFLICVRLWASPVTTYHARSISGAALFFILSGIFSFFLYSKKTKKIDKREFFSSTDLISLGLFVTLSIPFLVHACGFSNYIDNFKLELRSHTGVIAVEDTTMFKSGAYNRYDGVWTTPSLSVVLRPVQSHAVIINSTYSGWQPFDPRQGTPEIPAKYYD